MIPKPFHESPLPHLSTIVHQNLFSGTRVAWLLRAAAVRAGQFFFRYRDYLFPVAFLLLLLTTKPKLYHQSEVWDWWLDLIGIVIALIGQGCRVLAVGSVDNIRRGGRQKYLTADVLICHGPFAHSRNPLYVGNLLIVLGLALIANNRWWYFCAMPVFVGIYWAIVLAEEDFLRRQFGHAYTEYCQSVNRFLPNLTGFHRAITDCVFDWKRAGRKEYRIFCSWGSMAIGLLVWERWELFGYAARKFQIQELLLVWLFLCVIFRGLLWLKSDSLLRPSIKGSDLRPLRKAS